MWPLEVEPWLILGAEEVWAAVLIRYVALSEPAVWPHNII